MVVNMIINNKDFGIGYSNSNDKSLSKNEENYFNLPWSLSKIEDELVLHLSSYYDAEIKEEIASNINSNNNNKEIVVVKHPYQEQAKSILYKINLANRPLVFNIYSNTLSPKLKDELNHLYKKDRGVLNEIVTNSVKRLYESIGFQYFHMNGIGGKIAWTII
jgi:hypothetical protein